MTSSPETRVLRDVATTALFTPDLRQGTWTRLGGDHVRGDLGTETVLDELATRARTSARSQGYAVGWSEGRRAAAERAAEAEREATAARARATARHQDEHELAMSALRQAAARLDAATSAACTAVEQQASELACAVAEELVGHALLGETDEDVVRRAVRVLPEGERARLRLHPSVAASVPAADLRALGVVVVADSSVAREASVVELDDRLVSIDVVAALQRLREVLR
ncbi:hypothetical protein V3N99_01510 [Dermatophilaceae bacterium Soc4.6]